MISNKFKIQLFIRVILITANAIYLSSTLFNQDDIILNINLIALLFIQTIALYKYVKRISSSIHFFLNQIISEDFTSGLHSSSHINPGKTNPYLSSAYNQLSQLKRNAEKEKIIAKHIVEHIPIGIMIICEDSKVLLHNSKINSIFDIAKGTAVRINLCDIQFQEVLKEKTADGLSKIVLSTGKPYLLNVQTTVLDKQKIRMISLQEAEDILDQETIKSYHKLMRNINHEMMNSLTPILSMNGFADMLLQKEEFTLKDKEKARKSIALSNKRIEHLMTFIKNFKTLQQLPAPRFEATDIGRLIWNTLQLFDKKLEDNNTTISIESPTVKAVSAIDPIQIEQVLVNLLTNAIEATANQDSSWIKVSLQIEKEIIIQISNSGDNIPLEIQKDIFTPFFSTKKEGSGIGLAISKQIINNHLSQLTLQTKSRFTCFEIRLPIVD